ncbi:hypothetical protein ACTXT7_005287 [Hymenolepis weldensis]
MEDQCPLAGTVDVLSQNPKRRQRPQLKFVSCLANFCVLLPSSTSSFFSALSENWDIRLERRKTMYRRFYPACAILCALE